MQTEEITNEAVNEFLATQPAISARKNKNFLLISVNYLATLGVALDGKPTDENYICLKEYLKTLQSKKRKISYSEKTINDAISIVKKFYQFKKGNTEMHNEQHNEQNEFLETLPQNETQKEMPQNETQKEMPQNETQKEMPSEQQKKKKLGRKPIAVNGEARTEKVMFYFTPTLMADIKDLAAINGTTITELIIQTMSEKVASCQKKIDTLREMRRN